MQGRIPGILLPEPGDEGLEVLGQPLLALQYGIHRRFAAKRGAAAVNAVLERKQRLAQDLQTLIARLRQEYPRYAALHYPQPIPPEALPLKDQEVLLEY